MAGKRQAVHEATDQGRRIDYAQAFARWLKGLGYRVGIGGEAIEQSRFVDLAKALSELEVFAIGPPALAPALAGLLSGGADAEEAAARLEPIGGLVDVVGTQPGGQRVSLRVLLYGDDIAPDDIAHRLRLLHDFAPQLRTLATFRAPVVLEAAVTIEVLVAFFDPARYQAALDVVMEVGWLGNPATCLVRATCVDLTSHDFAEPAAKGLAVIGELLGSDPGWIDEDDLCHLDMLAEQHPGR